MDIGGTQVEFSEDGKKETGEPDSSSQNVITNDVAYSVKSSDDTSSETSTIKEKPEIFDSKNGVPQVRKTSSISEPLNPPERTPGYDDKPVTQRNDDLFGSSYFATYLAKRIIQIYNGNAGSRENRQFVMVHVYGAWGSGKTSFLNFLKEAFHSEPIVENSSGKEESQKTWSIVCFNAWREQHRKPPWWALMDAIFEKNKKNMKLRHQFSEYLSRMKSEKVIRCLTITVTLLAIAIILYLIFDSSTFQISSSQLNANETLLGILTEQAKFITTILALASALVGGIYIGVRSLIFGSSQAVMSSRDIDLAQRGKVKEHFERLIKNIPSPVAIFIDDLDRCKAEYVVELLEGIQTLLKEVPVAVIVAADRRWIHESYHEIYSGFSSAVREPYRPMEYLFLEKAFQMSVPMPELPKDLQDTYLRYLLRYPNKDEEKNEIEYARQDARKLLNGKNSEDEIMGVINAQRELSDIEKRAIMLESMVQLADKVRLENLERDHRLRKFAPLLEPYPRAMKRFVNDWDINRNIALWMGMDINKDQLALWTILMRRWPSLAQDLRDHPDIIRKISSIESGAKDNSTTAQDSERDSEKSELYANEEIRRVVTGQIGNTYLGVQIDEDVIKKCRFLCAN